MWGGIANLHENGRNRISDDESYSYQLVQAMNMRFQLLLNSLIVTLTKMIITQKNGLRKTIQIMCEMKYEN
jgi:hypothetical protein